MDSTNRFLMEADSEQFPVGSSLMARRQTAGRGRAQRCWESPPGGLYVSTVLKPRELDGLCLLGALAVVEVAARYGVVALIRWPNDVYVGGRKLAGVLPQARFAGQKLDRAVLGVGFNVAQEEAAFSAPLRPTSTTLSRESGRVLDPTEVCGDYLDTLESLFEWLEQKGCPELAARCEPHLDGLGRDPGPVVVDGGGELVRRYPVVSGLGRRGELRFVGGESLDSLGPDERLRFQ